MPRKFISIAAWALILAVAVATLSPLGLRPHLGGASIERFGAFALIGLLLGIAYPRHVWWVLLGVVATALGLELMQMLTPDRHGRTIDAVVKMGGGIFGVCLSWLIVRLLGRIGGIDLLRQRKPVPHSD